MELNAEQQAARDCREPLIFVAAGPGSGKSRVLVERVLSSEDRMTSRVILTFTNAAAHTLSERLKGCRCEFLGTLHGYCFRLLNRFGQRIGYRAGGVNLLTAEQSEELRVAAGKKLGWKGSRKAMLAGDTDESQRIWMEYRHECRRNNLVDYDTVLSEGLRLLQLPDVADACRVDELLVDEASDSSEVDWLIYEAFPAESKFFVGDSDQTIYGFRGARPDLFIRAATDAEFWK